MTLKAELGLQLFTFIENVWRECRNAQMIVEAAFAFM